ncbi:MAG: transposase [Pacificimonas sp.]|nr:transposase [Pacificimonas sp.]
MGRPRILLPTPGNTHDAKVAIQTINAVPPSVYLVADKGYDSNALRLWLIERGTTPVIPSKANRKVQIEHDRKIYRQRNVPRMRESTDQPLNRDAASAHGSLPA